MQVYLSNMSLGKPNEHKPSVAAINFRELYDIGYRGLVFDVDWTLVKFHKSEIDPVTSSALESAVNIGFRAVALSNWSDVRYRELACFLPFGALRAFPPKPNPEGFLAVFDYLGVKPDQAVVIGDRILTDVWGGNSAGAYTIYVDPFPANGDPVKINVVRMVERVLWLK